MKYVKNRSKLALTHCFHVIGSPPVGSMNIFNAFMISHTALYTLELTVNLLKRIKQ